MTNGTHGRDALMGGDPDTLQDRKTLMASGDGGLMHL